MECTDMERRILDMWPKFEDGSYVWFGDAYIDTGGDDEEIEKIEFNGKHIYIAGLEGFYTRLNPGERVKRPAPKVLDADGVEIKVGDTVWHEDGRELRVIGFDAMQDGETVLIVEYAAEPTKLGEVRSLSLTHVQPDSWKRLEDDATMSAWSYRDKYGLAVGVSNDEYIPTTVAFALDLIRRAKALAEKEAAR